MSDARWQRVKVLFEAALERPSTERAAFLASLTGEDRALREEVESLLAADAQAGAFEPRLAMASALQSVGFVAPQDERTQALATGRRIGGYEVLGVLGSGAMGEVYRARDLKLNREIALKVLPDHVALDPEHLARFRREAQLLAALNHPNIAAIYGFEESDRVQALVLELVEGPTLAERVARGPLPVAEALASARQIADALEAAHEKGIIHRDLKPANIKITANGTIKVLDFGLARVWEGAPHVDLTQSPTLTDVREHTILGTPAYMSPEQARGKTLDRRTDIWSFGCVLFEMLVGRRAFGGETVPDTIAQVLERDLDWQAVPPPVPDRVRDLLRRCLHKEPNRRLRDIGDARLELDEVLARPRGSATESAASQTTALRRRWLWIAVASAIVILAIAGTALLARSIRSESHPTFRQLTFRHGTIRGARLAADDRTVVYSATWIGAQPDLYLLRPENPQSGSLGLGNTGIFSASSQGELAVALGCRLNWGECIGTLARVPMTGGSPREMVKDVQIADWSPDGRNLAIVSFTGGRYRLEYPIGKALYEPAGWITSARISPAGDRIAFLDHPELGDVGGSVAVIDLAGKKATLSSGWTSLQGLAWSSRGDEVWFTGSRTGKGGSSALYAVTLTGREREVFSSPGTLKLNDIAHGRDGVLLTRGTMRGGIMSLAGDEPKERELSWFDYSAVADLSADGRTLLFSESGEGVGAKPTIFIRKTDGSDAVRLGEGRPLALSPDGQWAIAIQESTPSQLVLLPTATGDLKRMPRGPIIEYLDWAAWSPDGRRIFFAGRESGDVRRTYVQDVDGGDPRAVTPDGFVGLLLSPDGRTIAAVDRYGEYYLCAVDQTFDPQPIKGYVDGDTLLQWSADGRTLFVREVGNLVLRIQKVDLSTGARRFWKELAPPDPAVLTDIGSDPGQIRITPDGKGYAYTYWTFAGELYLAEGLK